MSARDGDGDGDDEPDDASDRVTRIADEVHAVEGGATQQLVHEATDLLCQTLSSEVCSCVYQRSAPQLLFPWIS